MSPAALFLDSPRNRGKSRPKAFPLGEPPTPEINCSRIERSTVMLVCGRLATGSLAAAFGVQAVSFPRSGCRRRRDGRHSLSVLPETGWKLSHSRSRSQAATSRFRSSARRRRGSRHAGGIPKGKALWSLLPTSGEAEVGPRREQKELYKLQSIHLPEERLPASPPPFQYTIFRIQSKLFPSRRRPGRALAIPP